jgi:subtilase family serine protease
MRHFAASVLALGAGLASLALASTNALPISNMPSADSGPRVLSAATDLGPVSPSTALQLTVWLKVRDQAGLRQLLAEQRAGKAHWLSHEQIDARFAPGSAAVRTVVKYLESAGFHVSGVGSQNLYVKATGTAAQAQSAFGVSLHEYNLHGTVFRASERTPVLPRNIAPLVAEVGGLSTLGTRPNVTAPLVPGAKPNVVFQSNGEGLAPKIVPLSALSGSPKGLVFSAQCFYSPTSVSFAGGGASASYQGNLYGANINNTALGTRPPCGYQPSELQTAYNLTPLYKAGLDGTGVTVAIVDAFGSTTVANDLATFSYYMGLPAPNLTIVGTPTATPYDSDPNLQGWADETTLDVEWVHAIAPGANILLVVSPDNSFSNLMQAIQTAAATPGVVAISNSWSGYESGTDVPLRQAFDQVLMMANAAGESVDFASGDAGNETLDLGYADVNYPASSPYATAIGGVSVGLDASDHIDFQSSWGNNITELADTIALGSPPIDPPNNEGFLYGGGGGTSNVYPAPSFQRQLGGEDHTRPERRMVPDVSWVADPYTGVEIILTSDPAGDQGIAVIGGTSLATPMFSALWGITTQAAGHNLGDAAPYLYRLPPNAIMDVQAVDSRNNVTGELTDSNGTQKLTSWDLALPLQGQATFYSALYNSPFSTRWFVLTFGDDSTLAAGPGWDPATGVGTPNGWNFVQAIAHGHGGDGDGGGGGEGH